MNKRKLALAGALLSVIAALPGCTQDDDATQTPVLEPRGTVLTTVKATRQDLTNRISLTGKVAINPVFGIVAPATGEVRYVQRPPSTTAVRRPTWVATVWEGTEVHMIRIPKGSTMAGRLMTDRAAVTEGMPIVSAKYASYGIVADIDSAQAYRIAGAVESVQGQIKNGPGPFPCEPLGTIAALPAGTIPEPTATPSPNATATPTAGPQPELSPPAAGGAEGSEPTGLRLVCTAPSKVKLINGAAVTLDLVTGKATDVLVLPVEAVAGTQGKGKVDLVDPDRNRKTVDVTLGLTDGKFVEIKSGLTGDETVAVPGPNLPAPAPDAEGADVQPAGTPG